MDWFKFKFLFESILLMGKPNQFGLSASINKYEHYTTSSASYKKRMPDGSFQQGLLDRSTNANATMTITQINQAKKLMSSKVSLIATPAKHTWSCYL